ncbi:ATP-binding protein [Streptomyces profundus]|uniref:ATP-binding protein n=1 Tax=Streptomyces profundus TaxID=2867410 RepID=UPI001D16B26D|nr:ATP-binding protein [Streptomyces sp. MA3_2.13]UED83190.1 ATP-binding protein [Streptomyces sp. MA3_2.13]
MSTTTLASPFEHPTVSHTLPRAEQSAATARRLTRAALAQWGLGELADDVALVVSELVTNAVQHTTCASIRVRLTRLDQRRVQVAVVDKSHTPPMRRTPTDSEDSGRGLTLVEAVTTRWGTDPLPWGKRVWADLELTSGT